MSKMTNEKCKTGCFLRRAGFLTVFRRCSLWRTGGFSLSFEVLSRSIGSWGKNCNI
jgi:hypothetical protein